MGICSLDQNYMFLRNNVYRNKTVHLARSAIAKENVVLNEHCFVDEGTHLANTVVGKNCKIGRNCVLENAFLLDNVQIGDKCILKNCVIGRNSEIQKETAISNGAVIGNDCIISENIDKEFVVSKQSNDEYDECEFFWISKIGHFINNFFT